MTIFIHYTRKQCCQVAEPLQDVVKKKFIVESLPVLFIRAGAGIGAGEKNLEPVKNGPAPQHWACFRK